MILTFSVAFPIAAIVCLILFFFKRSGQISRREEAAIDAAVLEGDLGAYVRSLNSGEAH